MKKLESLFKSLLITLIFIFLFLFLISTFYYFDLLSSNVVKYLRVLTIFFSIFIGSYIVGKKSDKNGYLEGLKYGGTVLGSFLLIALFFFRDFFQVRFILYDIILLTTSVLGSMIGINRKKS